MADVIYTAPVYDPLTLDEAKEHLQLDINDDDALIGALIKAAANYCEMVQNRAYITQTRELWLDGWPRGQFIELRSPLASVTHVKYYGTDDTEYTMDAADYFVDIKSFVGRVGLAYGKSWPSTTLRPFNGVVVRYTCGAAIADSEVKQAMLLLVGHWYENREAIGLPGGVGQELALTVKALLGVNRKWPI